MRGQRYWWLALFLVGTGISTGLAETDVLLPVADEIRIEALRSPVSDIGHPLPLAGSWCAGSPSITDSFTPAYQMDLIAKGHYLLPWFIFSPSINDSSPEAVQKPMKQAAGYYEAPLREAARLRLPISFVTGEWEQQLSTDKKYFDLPADQNPNFVTKDGKILPSLSAWGPVAPWREVGVSYGKTQILSLMQQWYPDPPVILFVCNNEAAKGGPGRDLRFLQAHGNETNKELFNVWAARGWEERYRALQHGFMDQFQSADWKSNTLFVGYDVWGRPTGNRGVSLAGWDGGSPSYYVINGADSNDCDFKFGSPQTGWMDGPEISSEIYKAKPRFWFDLSIWDGNEPGGHLSAVCDYAKFGQTFPPERYGGFVQFGLWLLRPRVAREYRDWEDTRTRVGSYFLQLVEAVDRVHTNPVLRAFWRKGELVPNKARAIKSEKLPGSTSGEADYWFLLDTDLDPPRPWTPHKTVLPVFSLALVKGQKPSREWLVYAHAPLGARRHVGVTVPEFGKVTLDVVAQSGSFYLLSEKTKQLTTILAGGPASVRVSFSTEEATVAPPVATKTHKANRPAAHDEPKEEIAAGTKLIFTAADPYSPTGELTGFRWDFGDGKSATGLKTEHAYQKNGRYIAEFTAKNGAGPTLVKQLPVSVGQKPDPGLVVFYPPFKIDDGIMYDASGRTNNAMRVGGRWVDDPERGPALELDGKTDHVSLAHSHDINTGGPYPNRTVMLWFNARDTKPGQILYAEGSGNNGLNIFFRGGQLQGGIWATESWPGTWVATEPILANHWYPVALVLRDAKHEKPEPGDADNLELYLNGKKVSAGVSGQLPKHKREALTLAGGGSTLFPDKWHVQRFAGRLGEVRVYNRALSPAEIAEWSKKPNPNTTKRGTPGM